MDAFTGFFSIWAIDVFLQRTCEGDVLAKQLLGYYDSILDLSSNLKPCLLITTINFPQLAIRNA